MNVSVPGYRLTSDDLVDADKKTKRALEPLLGSLNRCLTNVISALNGLSLPSVRAARFTTDSAGAGSLELGLGTTPKELWVSSIAPASGAINAVYASAWVPITSGARVNFFGLAASTTYAVAVRYL